MRTVLAPRLPLEQSSGSIGLEVDTTIYSRTAVLRASYAFTNRAHVFLTSAGEDRLLVVLRPRKSDVDLEELAGELSNSLIDQELRLAVLRETGAIRELVVAHALAEGNLLDPDRDAEDYEADPQGIGTSR